MNISRDIQQHKQLFTSHQTIHNMCVLNMLYAKCNCESLKIFWYILANL